MSRPAWRTQPGRWARWAAAGAVVAMAGPLLAGCGIPAGTDVRVDGPLPEAGPPQGGDSQDPPPGPDEADSPTELVEHFLQAAAANPQDPLAAMGEFLLPEQRAAWQPDPQILVVRPERPVSTPAGGGRERVQVTLREVGVLTDGTIEPRDVAGSRAVQFEVVQDTEVSIDEDIGQRVGEPRYRLVDAPDEILLSTAALENEYLLSRPIYFWGSDGEVLVPDLRWLPRALAERQRAQTVLKWLEDGPASWLPGTLAGLPEDVSLAGNVVVRADEGQLEVPLTPAAGEVDPGRLDAQLWWTLRPELTDRRLTLSIDGQFREVDGNRYLADNPTTRPAPARFAVVDGVVRQHRPDEELDLPALAGRNEALHSAALTGDRRAAAVVRPDPGGLRLAVSRPAAEVDTGLVREQMSRPVWLAGGTAGLVAAGGVLYRFDQDGEISRVRVPGEPAGIQAVAAAPDGRRIALVADGRLYVASMVWREGSFSVNEPRVLPTTAQELEGVGFLQENWLAYVGVEGGESQLYEITVDGALERILPQGQLGLPVSVGSFTAYPGDPTTQPPSRGEIMYEAESLAYHYRYGFGEAVQIEADALYGVPADPDAEPGDPRAPFFLG